jgi:hypothetical protein
MTTPSDEALIRYIGAGVRESLCAHYGNRGPDFGYRVSRRIINEVAANVAENHTVQDGVEMLYRAGDRLAKGIPLGVLMMPGEELMPGPSRALAAQVAIAGGGAVDPSQVHEFTVPTGTMRVEGDAEAARAALRDALAAMDAQLGPDLAPLPLRRRVWRWITSHANALLVGYCVGVLATMATR